MVMKVLGPYPGSSALVTDLSQIPGEVAGLITDVVFHGTLGVLTSVASHYPTLDFRVVGRGYTIGWSDGQLCELGRSLEPITTAIAETTTTEWLREAQSAEAGSSAALVEPALDQGNPPVHPALQLHLFASSANVNEAPQ
jgi:hypothetical protein